MIFHQEPVVSISMKIEIIYQQVSLNFLIIKCESNIGIGTSYSAMNKSHDETTLKSKTLIQKKIGKLFYGIL